MLLRETPTIAVVQVDARFRQLLADHHVFIADNGSYERWGDNTVVSFTKDTLIEPYTAFFRGETLCTMGAFSYSHSPMPLGMRVGRYCSIAGGLKGIGSEHPIAAVSTSPAFYDRRVIFSSVAAAEMEHGWPWKRMPFHEKPAPVIGNDVWLTAEVGLNRGAVVGDGAIILRNAMVSTKLDGFWLYGGIPARAVRPRFPGELGVKMAATEWWQLSPKDLAAYPMHDPAAFVEQWESGSASAQAWKPAVLNLWDEVQRLG
ncbi:LbetaH domain-containing protein [Roseomonas elaeocarpi]|uniref:Acetyltransferase n=1 Tax=Roseomonas elaeocarpi TaxID=907779 RepID=A0ABV6JMN8_9PROT